MDSDAPAFLLGGDETAIAALSPLLEALPRDRPVHVHIEVADREGRVELPDHPRAVVHWHDLAPGAPAGDAPPPPKRRYWDER